MAASSAAAASTLLVRLKPDTTVNVIELSSASFGVLVDRFAVVFGAAVIPRPRARGQFAVLLGDLPRRLERLRILNDDDRLHHHVVGLAHARRDLRRVAQDKAGAVDDDVVVSRFLEPTGFEDERVAFP